MLQGVKTRILTFLDLGVGEVNPVLWQPDKSQHHKTELRINPIPHYGILWQRISDKYEA